MLWERPIPVSSMPPHQTGMPRSIAALCTATKLPSPPTRPFLMLMMRQDSISMAARVSRRLWMDSSRQMGVLLPLQHGVVVEVVVPERLLDHHPGPASPADDDFGVLEFVGGVGIAAGGDAGPAVADSVETSVSQPNFNLMRW